MAEPVTITFLGGLGEIGRNCAAIEQQGQVVLIDCGLMFPDLLDMPGVDLVLPDFTWLRQRSEHIVGCVLTHGHEDHIGALSYLLGELSFPIYGSALTLGLARGRIEEAGLLDRTDMVVVRDGERRKVGPFDVEFLPVTHSVPHGFALAFHTAQGVILHSGDFKLDMSPVDGRHTDLARIGSLAGPDGVRLLLSDSTNAEEAGHTASESSVGAVLTNLFRQHEGRRIVTACFASHIHRVQQVADAALSTGRVVATLGRSMARNVALARQLGILRLPDDALVDIEAVADMEPGRVCVISTGSQGEPMSALSLMSAGGNKWLQIGADDVVIISAHPIPGNESAVSRVIDGLHRRGAEVIHSGLADVHVSGHAMRGELQTLLSVSKPQWFVPVHGEYRHLYHHAQLARAMGVPADQVLLCEDGDVITVTDDQVDFTGEVPAGYLYVDGIVGDVGHGVLRDRRALAEEGVIVVVVGLDATSGEVITGPEIITRGWVHAPEAEPLLDEARAVVRKAVAEAYADAVADDPEAVKKRVRQAIGRLVHERTRRRPMIVPVVMEA